MSDCGVRKPCNALSGNALTFDCGMPRGHDGPHWFHSHGCNPGGCTDDCRERRAVSLGFSLSQSNAQPYTRVEFRGEDVSRRVMVDVAASNVIVPLDIWSRICDTINAAAAVERGVRETTDAQLVNEATERAYAMQEDAPEVSALIARLANSLSNHIEDVEEFTQRAARAEEDTRRLDWLQSGEWLAGPVDHTGEYIWKWDPALTRQSLREAIDADRRESDTARSGRRPSGGGENG